MTSNHKVQGSQGRSIRLAVGVAMITASAAAATLRVEPNGEGDYRTIPEAIAAASAGDTIRVGKGTYDGAVVIDKDLTLVGDGPQYCGLTHTGGNTLTVSDEVVALVQAFSIASRDGSGIRVGRRANVTVRNCVIADCTYDGVVCSIDERTAGATIRLYDNTIVRNRYGVDFYIRDGASGSLTMDGNIVAYNRAFGNYLTIASSRGDYNCWYGNAQGLDGYNSLGHGPNLVQSAPNFVDPENANFVLRSNSPCINKGAPGLGREDPDGSRADLGAFSGPASREWWPYLPGGPLITELNVRPGTVPQGGTVRIEAVGRVR